VPPDIMPYPMGSWLSEASPAEQRALQDETVGAIARLHAIDPEKAGADFLAFGLPGATALRRHVENQRRYYDWMREGRNYPLLERAFAWLDGHWPASEGDTVISWGDSRIGNVLYDGFAPAAVLDWEMAALGPRGLDLGWLCFMHAFFQMIARGAGLSGMPDFLRAADVADEYARLTAQRIDLRWYEAYAALRHGIIMARIQARAVHFADTTLPDDLDATIPHRPLLEQMLAGTYWD
jgi:aminoglycoside phosphotransferase (APT) family kinase protein